MESRRTKQRTWKVLRMMKSQRDWTYDRWRRILLSCGGILAIAIFAFSFRMEKFSCTESPCWAGARSCWRFVCFAITESFMVIGHNNLCFVQLWFVDLRSWFLIELIQSYLSSTDEEATGPLLFWTNPHPLRS